MSTSINPGESIWRLGFYQRDANHFRWLATETWWCVGGNTSPIMANNSAFIINRLRAPFGPTVTAALYPFAQAFVQPIYPPRLTGARYVDLSTARIPLLNTSAPEAAFRLQRVGALSGSPSLGRICLPILNDSVFTDLPHRRHLDLATLTPLLDANLNTKPFTIGTPPTLRCVIWHRKTLSYDQVDSYSLKDNPVRIWQRWRPYPQAGHTVAVDDRWRPSDGDGWTV